VAGLFAVGAMARTARELVRVADGYQNIQGRLRLVTQSQEQLGRVTAEVFGISQRTFASMDSTATLVARTTRALVSNGAAQDEALQKSLRMSEAINNAFLVSGASAAESTNAIIQLTQGLAAGALRGEEFNSIAEQGPRILQALGEYLGKSTGELRAFAKEGGITAEVIQGALLGSFQRLQEEAAQMPLTVSRSMVQLSNSWQMFVGEMDSAAGVSRIFAESISGIAQNLQPIMTGVTALGAVIAVNLGTRAVSSMAAWGASTFAAAEQQRALAADVATAAARIEAKARAQAADARASQISAAATLSNAEAEV